MNNGLNKLHTTTNRTFADGNIKYWEYEWLFDFLNQFTSSNIEELNRLITNLQNYNKSLNIRTLVDEADFYAYEHETLGRVLFIAGDMDGTQLVYRYSDNQFIIYHTYFENEAIVINPEKLSIYLGYLLSIFTFGKFNEQTIFFEHIKQ